MSNSRHLTEKLVFRSYFGMYRATIYNIIRRFVDQVFLYADFFGLKYLTISMNGGMLLNITTQWGAIYGSGQEKFINEVCYDYRIRSFGR